MLHNVVRRAAIIGLFASAVATFGGCDKSPTAPPPPAETPALRIFSVTPAIGFAGEEVRITGSGFISGAAVAIGGVPAAVTSISGSIIGAVVPKASGEADVVVTNPDGASATLAKGYTVNLVVLNVNSVRVSPGGQLAVDWVVPSTRSGSDWVGLFRLGVPSTSYEEGWWEYTRGAVSGRFTVSAPAAAGDYEFRYLLDDG